MGTSHNHLSAGGRPPCPDHFCSCYGSERERGSYLRAFVREGLRGGERIVCIVPEDPHRLRDFCLGPLPEGALSAPPTEQAEFLRPESVFMQEDVFSADQALYQLESCIRQAQDLGFRGLRVLFDGGWLRANPLGIHQVVEYESRVNAVIRSLPCRVLCLYPRRVLSRSFLVYVLLAHPYLLRGDRLFFNPCHGDYDLLMTAATAKDVYSKILKRLQAVPR
ncbi:MEDS: MEthanogen/methylotroph, DcmR Sensory domain [Desulfacinum infernum DSM 9756]|uniref:MEDS: MEthanogen/methylotroph, DcmR Sensory domain n=1 Tax=Desulfacinum infernum DSM 9756 TaxID=1121391 RepID=A0A1M4TB23_9BACT|nr:MEDS domain-containing protein [Desulfacinum infernum]SHE41625.1 MEDS: MEthanogen/methylotroph, DcmR Sensory domain [Desulfacinum infernum DSM 9756]